MGRAAQRGLAKGACGLQSQTHNAIHFCVKENNAAFMRLVAFRKRLSKLMFKKGLDKNGCRQHTGSKQSILLPIFPVKLKTA